MKQSDTNPALVVRAAGATCAFPVSQVLETMRPLPIQPVANLPAFVLGVALVRGVAMPVVSLSAFFDGKAPGEGTRFVTLRAGARTVAVLVDSVVGIAELSRDNFQELPPLLSQIQPEVMETIGRLDSELVVVLRGARLVPDSVWEAASVAGVAR
jgi:purine-binding chemotaxis protein CheW